jgi:hypothetical protein
MAKMSTLAELLKSLSQGASNSVASSVSAPVDGIAWALRKAGMPIPSNPVGGSDWMAQQGLTAEPKNRLAGLLGEGIGMAGPMVAAAKAPQIAGGLLQAIENGAAPRLLNPQAGMVKIPGVGQYPETANDVKKLGDRFGRLLDDANIPYSYDKSRLSPARYYTFDKPVSANHSAEDIAKYGAEQYKVRISDHKNIHGADFSVDPYSKATFEEMISSVQKMGVNIAGKVKPKNLVSDQINKKVSELSSFGDGSIMKSARLLGLEQKDYLQHSQRLQQEVWNISNLPKEQLTTAILDRLKQIQITGK